MKPNNPTVEEIETLGGRVTLHEKEHLVGGGCFYVSGEIPRKTSFEVRDSIREPFFLKTCIVKHVLNYKKYTHYNNNDNYDNRLVYLVTLRGWQMETGFQTKIY